MPRIVGLSVLLATAVAASAESVKTRPPVAIAFVVVGDASLTTDGVARRPLRLHDRLPAGTTVEVGQGARVALAFANGSRYVLGERSQVTLGARDLAARNGPVLALALTPPLPCLSPIAPEDHPGPRAGAVRIRGEVIAGLYPRHGATTLTDATVLRFQPVDATERYRVEVEDRRGTLVFEAETTASAVTVPAGILRPGTHYDWTVRTIDRAGPAVRGAADFSTLSLQAAAQREALRQALTREGSGEALALLAEVDRSLGLFAEARDELRAASETPSDTASRP